VIPTDDIFAMLPDGLPPSWLQRLVIWKTSSEEALRCLPFGCGADYARAFSAAGALAEIPGSATSLPALPIHPHNIFIQLWLETGLPGVFLFAAALISSAEAILARGFSAAASAVIAATAAFVLVVAAVEMSMWQVWRLAAIGIAAVILALAVKMGSLAQLDRQPALKAG
jgi:O-antigen ligase